MTDDMAAWVASITPAAAAASVETGLSMRFIIAHWAHETAWGTSSLAREHRNYAGINHTENADYNADGRHAGYRSESAFLRDYIRVMRLGYYTDVLALARSGASDDQVAAALGTTPYAEDPAYGAKLQAVLTTLRGPIRHQTPAIETGADLAMVGALAVALVAAALAARREG